MSNNAKKGPVRTAFTDSFNVRLPIVAGGLMWLSNADYVAAAARADIMAFITAASFPDHDALRAEIRRCRDLAEGKPFGVNVSMLPRLVQGEQTQQVFELIADEGVAYVETSGRSPAAYLPIMKAAGIKVLHKVSTVRHAVSAQKLEVDAISIVGAECGGHPGMEMVGSIVNAAWAQEQLHIPYLIGGGIGHGSQIIATLGMGAAGVVMGTRFLAANEIWAHDGYKDRIIEAKPTDTTLCMHSVRNTVRVLHNTTVAAVQEIERTQEDVTIEQLMPYVTGKLAQKVYNTGDASTGLLAAGHALAFVKEKQSFQEIVAQLENEMQAALTRIDSLRI